MSTVLVTGAGGFLGSAIVRRLVRGGELWDGSAIDRVVALVRPNGSLERLETVATEDRLDVERVDLADSAALGDLLRRVRPRAVVNAALDAAVYERTGVGHGALETLFAALAELPDARLVHAASAWVLAPGVGLDETAAVDPRSAYALHKAEEDDLLPVLGAATGVRWIDLRLFNLFGRYEKPSRLLPYLVAQLSLGRPADVSHGAQVRDFNDVDAAAEAFALALRAVGDAWNRLYHIGSGRETTVRELALLVAGEVGDPDLIRFGSGRTPDEALPALVADCSLARRVLGWSPEESLEARVRAAAGWWLARLRPVGTPIRREEIQR